jgi:DNA-binding response OmpR family regulator
MPSRTQPQAQDKPQWKPSILQVEDDEATSYLRAQVLRRAGCRVANVHTVRDALAAAGKAVPDVILCDVKLPDGSGFHVCREMHARHPGVPVILVSAIFRDDFAKRAGVFGGAAEYLVEPLTAADLVAAVRRQTG